MTRKSPQKRTPARTTIDQLAAEVAILRREVSLLSLQGRLDELLTRVSRLEADTATES